MEPDETLAAALDALLPAGVRSEDPVQDLVAAARAAMDRRRSNTVNGGAVLAALKASGLSWREISVRTGIPIATAYRWADSPPGE